MQLVRRLTNLPPSCAVVMKSGNLNFLEPSGPLQACNGTALPFYSPLNRGEPLARHCHIPEDMNIQPLLVMLVGPSSHTPATSTLQDARHHRHWQHVLGQVGGLHLSTLCFPLPLSGTVLGGTMELHGNNISLACFHGINFKSKSWALFSLKEPCISFATEAQEVPSPESKCRALK